VLGNNAASFYAGYFEELTPEQMERHLAPFGITTTIVNPRFFRRELLTEQSTNYAEASVEDYAERRAKQIEFWKWQNGLQSGDPAKLARAVITVASQVPPPATSLPAPMPLAPRSRRSPI
jgi:NAD(P)-dependent dehydrogenase (short-subunit alcohol dehydrogenase family)